MKRVLVTGGAGFLGSHLCKRLLAENYTVTCIDNLKTGSSQNITPFLDNPRFTFVNFDVSKPLPDNLEADYVFHLASPASPNHHSSLSYHALPMETMLVNTEGTRHLLEFCERKGARFLFTSTSEAYGDPQEHPQKESYNGNVSTTGPRSVYDEAKRFGETLTAYFVRSKRADGRIARLFNSYGPHMNPNDMRMVVLFATKALKNEPITVYGRGTQTRSLCYVSDTIEGIVALMMKPDLAGEVVNIGSRGEHTVLEYAEIIKKLTNSQSDIVFSEKLPENDPRKRRPALTKAKKLLGWEPKVTLEEGLMSMIVYLQQTHE